jgi:hypothetical protein
LLLTFEKEPNLAKKCEKGQGGEKGTKLEKKRNTKSKKRRKRGRKRKKRRKEGMKESGEQKKAQKQLVKVD